MHKWSLKLKNQNNCSAQIKLLLLLILFGLNSSIIENEKKDFCSFVLVMYFFSCATFLGGAATAASTKKRPAPQPWAVTIKNSIDENVLTCLSLCFSMCSPVTSAPLCRLLTDPIFLKFGFR